MSSISAVSASATGSLQTVDQGSSRQQFLQLMKAINSGDLSGARQAYAALTQAQTDTGKQPDPNSPIGQALAQIGQALQSGDINGAQQALAALKQQQGQGGHHHHHHAAGGAGPASAAPAATPASSPSTSGAVDIVA